MPRAKPSTLTATRLRELLDYDPATGVFQWKVNRRHNARVGAVAGYINHRGYRQIKIDGRGYSAHRLAWMFVHGCWPSGEIDHKNTTPGDNHFANLRDGTHADNMHNTRRQRNNTTGFKGVSARCGRYRAQIKANKKHIHLGTFDTPQAAHQAYCAASAKYHGAFGRGA